MTNHNSTARQVFNSGADLGTDIIEKIHSTMLIEVSFTTWEPRGFSWWAQDYRQHIWAETAWCDDGIEVFRICAESDFLCDVKPTDKTYSLLNALGHVASISAPIIDEENRTVRLHTSIFMHEQNEEGFLTKFISAVIIQAVEAQIRAEATAGILQVSPDKSRHPRRIRHPGEHHSVIDQVHNLYAPIGVNNSRWIEEPHFDEVVEFLNSGNCFASAGATGLTAEFAFDENQTSMLKIDADTKHPQLGNGLLLRLFLPINLENTNAEAIAASMNRLETLSNTRTPMIGSWAAVDLSGSMTLVYVTFLPNVMWGDEILLYFSMVMAIRSAWAVDELAPDVEGGDVVEIITDRFKKLAAK